jgi:GNAT superfamily N-acetyltransferase
VTGSEPVKPLEGAVVRPALPGDASAIARIHVRSWRAAYAGIVPQPILDGLSAQRRAEFWLDAIANTTNDPKWVVERDGRILGFAATGPARDDDLPPQSGEVHAIYVDPDAWSTGLGRALFATAVEDLAGRGFGGLVLWVLTDNARGRRFYEAAGWRPDGTRRVLDFGGTPIEEMRYSPMPAGTNGPSATPTVDG